MSVKGYGAPEVERAYTRAYALCQRLGDTSQLFPVLSGLVGFYVARARLPHAYEIAQRCLRLAEREQDPALLVEAHQRFAHVLVMMGELPPARRQLEQGLALYDPRRHHSLAFLYGRDPGVSLLVSMVATLWTLGYPDQARKSEHEAVTLAQALGHPFTLADVLCTSALFCQYRREDLTMQERVEAAEKISAEHGFSVYLLGGNILRGWGLTEHGRVEEGITQMRQCVAAMRATGVELPLPYWLLLLAEAHRKGGQAEEGLKVVAEALAIVDKNGERWWEAEWYRLKGELTLQQVKMKNAKCKIVRTQAGAEAEASFLRAIEVARHQSAKSLELRAVMSLSRLWQRQGKKNAAHQVLGEIYNWFTEGFDTKDLQEAKALLEKL